jgi:hypothetical protein
MVDEEGIVLMLGRFAAAMMDKWPTFGHGLPDTKHYRHFKMCLQPPYTARLQLRPSWRLLCMHS